MKFSLYLLYIPIIAYLLLAKNKLTAQNALNFDANNDRVQTAFDGVLGSANRTFEAWVYVNSGTTANIAILDYGMNAVGSRNTFNVGSSGNLSFISGGTNANISSAGNAVPDETWTHVAFVLNNATGFLYVNGAQVATSNLSTVNTPSNGTDLRIGERVPGGSIPFDGVIDEVRVWNYARTAAEISANMNNELCSIPSGLVAYYKFNEGIAGGNNSGITTTQDYGSGGNNGTLNNFALSGSTSNWVLGVNLTVATLTSSVTLTGCDSLVSPSGEYTWYTSGTYHDTVISTGGCDSALTVALTIASPTFSTITEEACLNYTSPSQNYTWTVSGTYHDTITNMAGCDSIITINLTINNTQSSITEITCDSFVSPSENYTWTASGVYTDTIENTAGCDSIITIDLTISGITVQNELTERACFQYTSLSGGKTWTQSGVYLDTILSNSGCDSIVTINLTIDTVDTKVTKSGKTLNTTTNSAGYQWINCSDNEPISGAISSSYSPDVTGNYAVIITQNECVDTSDCYKVNIVGVNDFNVNQGISVYPNPTSNILTIESLDSSKLQSVSIMDASGRVLRTIPFANATGLEIQFYEPKGIYFALIGTKNDFYALKVVKQ